MLEEVRNNGLYITNNNMNWDEEEEFTYVDPRGMTTIDYLLTNTSGKEIIQHMKIGEKIKSDHINRTNRSNMEGKNKKEQKGGKERNNGLDTGRNQKISRKSKGRRNR